MVVRRPFGKAAGIIYPEKGSREGGARVDFRDNASFNDQIEWHGVRLAWQRMTICPCTGWNNQTEQVNPQCPQCNGLGWRSFQTPGYVVDEAKTGPLDEEQRALVVRNNAMVIRGIPMGLSSQPDMFAALGPWARGSVMFTVRPENKLGYYDRLVYLDDVMPFSELVVSAAGTTLKTRYPVNCINALLSETQAFGDADVELRDGVVTWLTGRAPPAGTRLSISYLCHPVFVVLEYPHLIRVTNRVAKKPRPAQATPAGDFHRLPMQVLARLEYLPLEGG